MKISEELRQLWTYGFSYVEDLNIYACSYVAKYCMKKIKFIDSEKLYDYYYGREPEFLFMSRGSCQSNRCPVLKNKPKCWSYEFVNGVPKKKVTYYREYLPKKYIELNDVKDITNPFCKNCNKKRGGLGFDWFVKNYEDVKKTRFITIDGKKYPIPQYYKKLIKLTDDNFYHEIKNENIYYVENRLEKNPDINSTQMNLNRKKIQKAKNTFYNSRDFT